MINRKLGSQLFRWLSLAAAASVLVATAQAAGITSTKHNLSSSGTGSNFASAGGATDQICVFCHTPHGSDTSAAVPLWNKKLPTTSYATYNSVPASATSSINGQILTVGSVSLACLSCHDGTQAMDNMMNAPGAGGFNAAGASQAWTWTGTKTLASGVVTNLSADLKNDHPIGIAYCGGGLTGSGAAVSGICGDGDFISATNSDTSDSRTAKVMTALVNGRQSFWIDLPAHGASGAGDGKRGKQDISLYTRDFTSALGTPSVECGSCHDPHVESKDSDNIMFMRVTTAGSKICLSCHVK